MVSPQVLAKNYFVQGIGKLVGTLMGLVTVGVVARHFAGTNGLGIYTTANTFLSIFATIVDFGLTLTFIQAISTEEEREHLLVNQFLGLRLFSGLIFYSLAPIIVQFFPYSEVTKFAVLIGAVGFFFMTSAGMLIGIFQKRLLMWRYTISELINRLVFLAATIFFVHLNFNAAGIMWAVVLGNVAWFASIILLAKPHLSIRPIIDFAAWKRALSQSWPIGLSTICNLMYLRGDIVLLAALRLNGELEVSYYGIAYKVIDVLTIVPVMLMGLLLPQLTRLWKEENRDQFRFFLQKAFDFFMIISIPCMIGAQAVSSGLTYLIAGPKYEPAGDILRFLILSTVALFISSLYGHTVVAIHKQRAMVWGYAITAVLTLIGYIVFIPPYGMWGAAAMTLFSECLIAILTFVTVYRTTRMLPSLRVTIKALLSSIVMYAVLQLFPSFSIFVEIGLGAVVYFGVLFALGGIRLSMLRELLPNLKKT